MQVFENIVYGTEDPESQVLDFYLPEKEIADVFIYFHGGGLEAGDKKMDCLLPLVEKYGNAVVSANYRMYPKAVFPEFLLDGAKVVAWVKENLQKYIGVKRIFVGGSSAGAYMTAMLAVNPEYLGAYDIQTTDLDGYVIDSAQMTTHFNVLRERGISTKRILVDEAAPVFYVREEMQFPNLFVMVSDHDMPCRYEQTMMFLKTMEVCGCPPEKITYKLMQGYVHCEYLGVENVFADTVNEFLAREK